MTQDSNLSPTLVSIIVPVHNTGEYLNQCLQSCLDQTYQDIEVLAVDDCSTDEYTKEILRKFEEKDSRVKVIWLQENRGQGYCRNVGSDNCHGKYFTFIDSDDYFNPDFIERMYKGIEEFKTDFAICDTHNYVEDPSEFALKQFTLNDSATRFNFNAPDRSVVNTDDLISVGYLITFPASCYSKLFNTARYRECGVRFNDDVYSRHCEDEDWATLSVIKLKNFLVLKFVGLMRRMHPDSVSMPSQSHYRCGIDAAWRRYALVKDLPCAHFYVNSILNGFLSSACQFINLTEDYQERVQNQDIIREYLLKFGESYNTNPYFYHYTVGKGWHQVLGAVDTHPLPLVYFSLKPLHNSFNDDTYYTKQLLENLASRGIFTSSFNALKIDNPVPIQLFKDIDKNLAKYTKQDIAREQNEAKKAYKAGLPVTPEMTPTKPYNPNAPLLEFKDNGVSYLIAKTTPCLSPESYNDLDIEIIRQGLVKTVQTYFKKKGTGIVMLSGGDFLTQTLCAILKQKGYKVVYFVSSSADLEFATKKTEAQPRCDAEKIIAQHLENLLNGLDIDKDNAKKESNKDSTQEAKSQDEQAGAAETKADADTEANAEAKDNLESASKTSATCGKQEPVFNTTSQYIFDPSDFEAVFALTPYYAQRFTELYGVKAEYLGCAINPWVGTIQEEKSHNQIMCFNPTIQNGLAITLKIIQRYNQLHQAKQFTFCQSLNGSLQQDIIKLHDSKGNGIAKYKDTLAKINLVNDQQLDPVSLSSISAVLLKPMISDEENLAGVFESLNNNVPVLGSNCDKLRLSVGDNGILLDIPESTLKDPTCIPSDEEIAPWVDALHKLLTQPRHSNVSFADRKQEYDKTMCRWMDRLFEIVDLPEVHDYEGDVRDA